MSDTVRIDVTDRIATLTLNRPERLNALGDSLRDDRERLRHAVREVSCTLGEAPAFVPVGRLKAGVSARG